MHLKVPGNSNQAGDSRGRGPAATVVSASAGTVSSLFLPKLSQVRVSPGFRLALTHCSSVHLFKRSLLALNTQTEMNQREERRPDAAAAIKADLGSA